MEIPTGIFSDKIGRKKTIILSSLLFFITSFIWAFAGSLDNVLLLYVGAVIFGISDAFLSGTNEALMFETMEELKKEDNFDVLFSGDDWKGTERYKKSEEQFAKIGVSIEYLSYTTGISTTQIKKKILEENKK